MSNYTNPLGRLYKTPANAEEVKEKCKDAAKQGILIWRFEDCKDEWERLTWKKKARDIYGI